MSKKMSPIKEYVEAVGILKKFETSWPEAAGNRVLRETVANLMQRFLETIYELETERKGGEKGRTRKKSSQTE